jgi:hypothetical protein
MALKLNGLSLLFSSAVGKIAEVSFEDFDGIFISVIPKAWMSKNTHLLLRWLFCFVLNRKNEEILRFE